jgi:hypothetical protein
MQMPDEKLKRICINSLKAAYFLSFVVICLAHEYESIDAILKFYANQYSPVRANPSGLAGALVFIIIFSALATCCFAIEGFRDKWRSRGAFLTSLAFFLYFGFVYGLIEMAFKMPFASYEQLYQGSFLINKQFLHAGCNVVLVFASLWQLWNIKTKL